MKTSRDEKHGEQEPSHKNALQEALVRAICNGQSLDGLTSILAEQIDGCAAVSDLSGAQLSVSISLAVDAVEKKLLLQAVSAGGDTASGSNAVSGYNAVSGSSAASRSSPASGNSEMTPKRKLSSDAADEVGSGRAVYRITNPLEFSGEQSGTLTVIRCGLPFSEDEQKMISQAAGLFCVQLAQDKKIAEIELRLKGNFVEDLVSSHFSDPESILNRARALNYDILAAHRVLVAAFDSEAQLIHHTGEDKQAAARFKTDLVQSVQSCLNETHQGMVIFSKDAMVLLVRQNSPAGKIEELKTLADKIIKDAASRFRVKLFVGIGSVCAGLGDFSKSYMEAKKALEIGEYMITEGQVRSFEQFKVHALFLSTLKPADLYNYAREQLESLLAYDEKHGTDFLKTLQEFLYLRNNVEGTAKTLNMSVSGLKYRLQKIEKILGHNLKDYKVCFDLQLALVILQLFGENRIKDTREKSWY